MSNLSPYISTCLNSLGHYIEVMVSRIGDFWSLKDSFQNVRCFLIVSRRNTVLHILPPVCTYITENKKHQCVYIYIYKKTHLFSLCSHSLKKTLIQKCFLRTKSGCQIKFFLSLCSAQLAWARAATPNAQSAMENTSKIELLSHSHIHTLYHFTKTCLLHL